LFFKFNNNNNNNNNNNIYSLPCEKNKRKENKITVLGPATGRTQRHLMGLARAEPNPV
jgi:hypothetical protein